MAKEQEESLKSKKRRYAKKVQIKLEKKNREKNRVQKGILKVARKNFENSLKGDDKEMKQKAFQALDQVAQKTKSKGVIHKNKAARIVSRAYKKL